jgi:hypothetical protein
MRRPLHIRLRGGDLRDWRVSVRNAIGRTDTTYYTHRITNAVSEGLNSAIQTIKKRAGGYRNVENFKTAIYFHCGGLDLYPAPSSP